MVNNFLKFDFSMGWINQKAPGLKVQDVSADLFYFSQILA